MKIKLLKLFIYLVLIIIIGMLVTGDKEDAQSSAETGDIAIPETLFINAQNETSFRDNRVLATTVEKVAPMSNLPTQTRDDCPYYHLIKQYDWNVDVACAVMREESHFNETAYNSEGHRGCNGSFGLFQISCIHIGKYGVSHYRELYDPATNVRVAYEIWKENSWRPWGVCHKQNGIRKVRCWL